MTTRTASCSCGQLQARVQGEPVRISICHCLACQVRTGSVFASQARFPRAGFETTGESRTYVRTGDEGTSAVFHFCPTCGVTVWFAGDDDTVAIPIGTFADPGFPGPQVSVYENRKHAWVAVPRDIEHM